MLGFLKRIFSDQPKGSTQSLDDPVLGTLRLNDDATWWECAAETPSGTVNILIPGEMVPDPGCRAAAADLLGNFERINRDVTAFLRDEAEKKRWRFYQSIIPNLGIAGIVYDIRGESIGATIDLGQDDAGRVWRCSLEDGRVSNLVFDS